MACPICGRMYCDHSAAERDQTVEEMMADAGRPRQSRTKRKPAKEIKVKKVPSSELVMAHYRLPVIKLAPLTIRYDMGIEEVLAGFPHNPEIAYFSASYLGKTDPEEVELYLVQAGASSDKKLVPYHQVLQALDEDGYEPENIPALLVLKDYGKVLKSQGVECIYALGAGSVSPDPDSGYDLVMFSLDEGRGQFSIGWAREWDFSKDTWFIARRKKRMHFFVVQLDAAVP
jgi:hypothetical protein